MDRLEQIRLNREAHTKSYKEPNEIKEVSHQGASAGGKESPSNTSASAPAQVTSAIQSSGNSAPAVSKEDKTAAPIAASGKIYWTEIVRQLGLSNLQKHAAWREEIKGVLGSKAEEFFKGAESTTTQKFMKFVLAANLEVREADEKDTYFVMYNTFFRENIVDKNEIRALPIPFITGINISLGAMQNGALLTLRRNQGRDNETARAATVAGEAIIYSLKNGNFLVIHKPNKDIQFGLVFAPNPLKDGSKYILNYVIGSESDEALLKRLNSLNFLISSVFSFGKMMNIFRGVGEKLAGILAKVELSAPLKTYFTEQFSVLPDKYSKLSGLSINQFMDTLAQDTTNDVDTFGPLPKFSHEEILKDFQTLIANRDEALKELAKVDVSNHAGQELKELLSYLPIDLDLLQQNLKLLVRDVR